MGGRRGKGGKRRGASALGFSGVSEGLTLDEYVGAASTEPPSVPAGGAVAEDAGGAVWQGSRCTTSCTATS